MSLILPKEEVKLSTNSNAFCAFNRLRTCNPETLWDSKLVSDNNSYIYATASGGSGSIIYDYNNSCLNLSVTGSNDYAISQTRMFFNYQPGKSQLCSFTGVLDTEVNTTKRIGYFTTSTSGDFSDDLDGIFFENDGSNLSVNVAKNGVVDSIPQSSWNVDKLDGTGKSGITLDLSKTQIFIIDFQWLGVGTVRFGFVINEQPILVHQRHNANINDNVYMRSPNKPVRYEIRSNGGSGSLKQICSTIISEGGSQKRGIIKTINNDSTNLDADSTGTKYGLLGIRLQESMRDIIIDIEQLNIMSVSNDNFIWYLYINPTVGGLPTWNILDNSHIEYAIGATANVISNGDPIVSGYGTQNTSINLPLNISQRIGSDIDGKCDEIWLCVQPLSVNLDIFGSINFREWI